MADILMLLSLYRYQIAGAAAGYMLMGALTYVAVFLFIWWGSNRGGGKPEGIFVLPLIAMIGWPGIWMAIAVMFICWALYQIDWLVMPYMIKGMQMAEKKVFGEYFIR